MPTKVLILSNVPSPYLSPVYAQVQAESGWDVMIAYSAAWNAGVGWTPEHAASFVDGEREITLANRHPRLARLAGNQIAACVALVGKLLRWRPDYAVIYGYTLLPQMLLIVWSAIFGIQFALAGDANVFSDHAQGWRKQVKGLWLRWLARRAAALLTVGTACRMFWEAYDAPPAKLFHVGFAVDNEHFRRASLAQKLAAAELRQRFGWEKHTVYLFVGRLIARKHVHQLIAAAKELSALPIAVLIAGDGAERAQLEQLAAGQANVRFVGTVTQTELPLYYAAADVLVLAAHAEPWGLVVNEAMASGLAVIAHRHCGATLDLVAADNGAILETYESAELRDSMRALAQDPQRLQACKERSLEKIQAWTMPQAAAQLQNAIRQSISKSREHSK